MPLPILCSALLGFALVSFATEARASTTVSSLDLQAVDIRPGVTANLHLTVHERSGAPCEASTVLLIPGSGAAAVSLDGLADALVDDENDRPVCRAMVLDLPAHGRSGRPVGALFGSLSIDDYASTVIALLARLRQIGVRPWTLIGHSLGGGIIERMHQRLLDRGSSLKGIGVRHVVLLGPSVPAASPWELRDLGLGALLLGPFRVSDPVLGEVLAIPPELWPVIALRTLDGTFVDSPQLAELIAHDAIGPESWAALGGILGLGGTPLTVARGAFAADLGTRLDIVSFGQDTLVSVSDLRSLFGYLTGSRGGKSGLTIVDTPEAVHAMPIIDPSGLVEILADDVSLP